MVLASGSVRVFTSAMSAIAVEVVVVVKVAPPESAETRRPERASPSSGIFHARTERSARRRPRCAVLARASFCWRVVRARDYVSVLSPHPALFDSAVGSDDRRG